MEKKLETGKLVITERVQSKMFDKMNPGFFSFVYVSLGRHACRDWGDLDDEDKMLNDDAIKNGGRIFSVYSRNGNEKIWIITEADRSVTTVLFPEEY